MLEIKAQEIQKLNFRLERWLSGYHWLLFFPEDLGSISRTCMVAQNHLYNSSPMGSDARSGPLKACMMTSLTFGKTSTHIKVNKEE